MLSPSDKTHPVFCFFFFASAYFSVSLSVRKSNINTHSVWVCVSAHQTPKTHYRIRLLIHMCRLELNMRFVIPYTHPYNTHGDSVAQQWVRLGTRKHVYGVLRSKSVFLNQRGRGRRESQRAGERRLEREFTEHWICVTVISLCRVTLGHMGSFVGNLNIVWFYWITLF